MKSNKNLFRKKKIFNKLSKIRLRLLPSSLVLLSVPLTAEATTGKSNMSAAPEIFKINISGYSMNEFKNFNPTGYTLLCRLGETCEGLNYFPATSKIVLTVGEQSQIVSNFHNFLPNVAQDLAVTDQVAAQTVYDFFIDKKVSIQPIGIQGKFYNAMRTAQNYLPMVYTSQAVATIKTAGITGFQVVSNAPLTFVGATYVGAVFLGYCGGIAGDNVIGLAFNTTSYVLSRPMKGVEIVLNGLLLRPLSNVVGMPLILNGTEELTSGIGIPLQDYVTIGQAVEKFTNSTLFAKIKQIYKIVRSKG